MHEKLEEIFVEKSLLIAATSAAIITLFIVFFIFVQGLPAIIDVGFFNFMFGTEWQPLEGYFGALPMIIGSLYITGLSLLMAIPFSLSCAIFLAEFAPRGMKMILKPAIQALAGVPSVVYGFFGMMVIVPFIREQFGGMGFSILAASLILTVMILPTITSLSEDAIKSIPLEYKEASFALGATHWQTIKNVLFPAALPGILTGILLGLVRGIGEAMIVMVAGNLAIIPDSILDPARALTVTILIEMGFATGIHRSALFATGIILFLLIGVPLVITNYIYYKKLQKASYYWWRLPLMSSRLNFRIISPKNAQRIMKGVFWGAGILAILILLAITGYIIIMGLPAINLEFLLNRPLDAGRAGGIFPMIVSTIYLALITLFIASPLGVGAGIYISEYAGHDSKIPKAIRFTTETFASIPSIVLGLFGLAFFVIFLGFGFSILSGGLVLAIMALPMIIHASEVSIEAVPQYYREGSFALGATKWQTVYRVVLPAALPGIATGIILGMIRAIAETAAIMMIVGTATMVPASIFDPARPLPLHLYLMAIEGIILGGISLKNAFGTAAVLVTIVLITIIVTNVVVEMHVRKMMGR